MPFRYRADYRDAVAEWHAARAQIWADAIAAELGPHGVGGFLAWGDPSLYDSTLRILDTVAGHVEGEFDVIPGITAVQALTARHRIPLNEVGAQLATGGDEHGLAHLVERDTMPGGTSTSSASAPATPTT
ncbi:hypothetical protein JHV675_53920 [Mycobacterium avium subsp. hominissuis]